MSTSTPKRGPGRPPLAPEERPVRLSVSLPPGLYALVEQEARRAEVSAAEWLRRAALTALAQGR